MIATAAVLLAPAAARADCGDQIIDEVINTGQVNGDYELRCFDLALGRLNPDLEEYGEAPSIIRTAKVAQRDRDREQAAAPPSDDAGDDVGGGGGGDDGGSGDGGQDPAVTPGDDPAGDGGAATAEDGAAGSESASGDRVVGEESGEDFTATGDGDWVETGGETVAADAFQDEDGGIAVGPMILGGLAVGLIAVGGGGMVYRKLNER